MRPNPFAATSRTFPRPGSLLIALLAFLLIPMRDAHAARFGNEQNVRFLQDVGLKGPQQEALYLGYMTETFNIFVPVYIVDKGYVLGVKGESKKYYPLPTGEELARLQKAGLLPDPLPPYRLSFLDYIFGHLLWFVIAFAIISTLYDSWRKKRKAAAAAAEAPSPDAGPQQP